jgi:hypothetical protein
MADASPQPSSVALEIPNGTSPSQGPTSAQETPEINVEFDEVFDEIWRKKNAQAEAYFARRREEFEEEAKAMTYLRGVLVEVVEALSHLQTDQEHQASANSVTADEGVTGDAAASRPIGNGTVLSGTATNGAIMDDEIMDDFAIMEGVAENAGAIEVTAVGDSNAAASSGGDANTSNANAETSAEQAATLDIDAIEASNGEGPAVSSVTQLAQQTLYGTRQESAAVASISERIATTPPVDTLPYLAVTSLNRELPELQECRQVDEEFCQQRLGLMSLVRQAYTKETQEDDACRRTLTQDFRAWFQHVESVDADSVIPPVQNPGNACARALAAVAAAPATTISPVEGRRGGRFSTEYDLQRVLRESELAAAEVSQGASDPAVQTNNTASKYATIPDMEKGNEGLLVLEVFETNRRLNRDHLDSHIRFLTEGDDFTPEEHQRFVAAVSRVQPKQWRRLADAVGNNRTPLDCIRHYYWTKESIRYKDLFKNSRGRRPRQTAQSSRLGQRAFPLEDDDAHGGALALTETGRPRRAAAPTFGELSATAEPGAVTQPTRRRAGTGLRQEGDNAQPDRGSRRGRGGATRERGQRRPRGQPIPVAPSPPVNSMEVDPSPSIFLADDVVEEKEEQILDVEMTQAPALVPAGLAENGVIIDDEAPATVSQSEAALSEPSPGPTPIPVSTPIPVPASLAGPAPTAVRASTSGEPTKLPRPQQRGNGLTSSYWSVPESNIFPQLLDYFGTDWKEIANHMKTKTHNMVSRSSSICVPYVFLFL